MQINGKQRFLAEVFPARPSGYAAGERVKLDSLSFLREG
jgi:hypothetical protein